ncbi:enhancer of AG-4 protein 2-like [Trifolium pratense]|uniref:Enhancer of AG-4 protein 2-like n=1 Tax=Trifolium pratense TaxID=57577 RepID=A0A2K3PG78_TRIPR|nr:enhancer of AG-4 protein 2-like [Trifolium pratense]
MVTVSMLDLLLSPYVQVVELLIRKLENETSFHRKVDLFFLVDSITQCSHSQKGIAGASYIPIVQAALPRLLGAAAPPGASARENRRQCHKAQERPTERLLIHVFKLSCIQTCPGLELG